VTVQLTILIYLRYTKDIVKNITKEKTNEKNINKKYDYKRGNA